MTASLESLDWSIPETFLERMNNSLRSNLDELLPAGQPLPPKRSIQNETPAFLAAMQSTGDVLTENGAKAHSTTTSPLVDLFFELTPGVESARLFNLLHNAWDEDPESTLRIIFHARSIHEGKGAREECFKALAWVWVNHPRTLLENLRMLVEPVCKRDRSKSRDMAKIDKLREGLEVISMDEDGSLGVEGVGQEHEYPPRPHGSFKDLIDLLILQLHGQFTTAHESDLTAINESLAPAGAAHHFRYMRKAKKEKTLKSRERGHKELSVLVKQQPGSLQHTMFEAQSKKARHDILAERIRRALQDDAKFQALYLTVLNLFVTQIQTDLARLKEHRAFLDKPESERLPYKGDSSPYLFGLSYAAKWAPSIAKGADKQLHFATALARKLVPTESSDIRARAKLQKEILAPLRAVMKVPETRMGKGEWKVDYTKVPSRAMSKNIRHFRTHDPEGIAEFLRQVVKGRYAISGASLFPHELLLDAISDTDPIISQLADLQWKSLVDSVKSSSKASLTNCLAIADVSGSMGCFTASDNKKRPSAITVCIALTLLLGELAESPWNGSFFTFSTDPQFQTIDPSLPLSERAHSLSRAEWGMSTNFIKVFDLILSTAKREHLKPDQMVSRLFVFSDMQFDNANRDRFTDTPSIDLDETTHQTIRRKFTEAGYQIPELVYWNLAARFEGGQPTTKPVQSGMEGVSLVSGFSGSLMKHFLGQEKDGEDEDMMDWENVALEVEDQVEKKETKTDKESGVMGHDKGKKRPNPLERVMKILAAESLRGVRVLD